MDPRFDLWLHGASVGDARALAALLAALAVEAPTLARGLTVGRTSGRDAARRWYPGLPVLRPPWPLSGATGRFLRRHGARLLILEYLELWPGVMAACEHVGVPVAIVDGRVGPRSLRARAVLRRAAGRVSLFCAQTPEDADGAVRLGVSPERVHVTGNGKHDAPVAPPAPTADLVASVGPVDLVVGSLHRDEEGPATAALAAFPGRILWAPRQPGRAAALMSHAHALGISAGRRSQGAAGDRWVVLDTVGELAAAWGLGRVALVGGTFCRREGQNLVEAARHGLPIIHGPRVANVAAEARALDGRGAKRVADWSTASAEATALLAGRGDPVDPRPALESLRGAVSRQITLLRPLLEFAARH